VALLVASDRKIVLFLVHFFQSSELVVYLKKVVLLRYILRKAVLFENKCTLSSKGDLAVFCHKYVNRLPMKTAIQ